MPGRSDRDRLTKEGETHKLKMKISLQIVNSLPILRRCLQRVHRRTSRKVENDEETRRWPAEQHEFAARWVTSSLITFSAYNRTPLHIFRQLRILAQQQAVVGHHRWQFSLHRVRCRPADNYIRQHLRLLSSLQCGVEKVPIASHRAVNCKQKTKRTFPLSRIIK